MYCFTMTAQCRTLRPTCVNTDNMLFILPRRRSARDDVKQHIQKYARVATIVSTYRTGVPVLSADKSVDNAELSVTKPDRPVSDVPAPI